MKKLIFLFCVALMPALVTGCSDKDSDEQCPDVLRDYVTVSIAVLVVDADGNNLLDPGFEGNILEDDISVKSGSHTYKLNEKEEEARPTRATMPKWYGLRTIERSGVYYLAIGEYGIGSRETLIYDWGDGTTDEVRFAYYATPGEGCDPEVHAESYLNGAKVTGGLKIVK